MTRLDHSALQRAADEVAGRHVLLPGGPGFIVTIRLRGDDKAWAATYGCADVASGRVLEPGTRFHVGSVSKQFTAACIGQLVRVGAVSLQDTVQHWLPEVEGAARTITIEQLFQHTSGLWDIVQLAAFVGWSPKANYGVEEALRLIGRQPRPDWTPGERFGYSNTNYLLLGLIIERASGEGLRDFSRRVLFAPLGMDDTYFRDRPEETDDRLSHGYLRNNIGEVVLGDMASPLLGYQNLVSTAIDLQRWASFLWELDGFEHSCMARPLDFDTSSVAHQSGVLFRNWGGRLTASHGGMCVGYRAFVLSIPDLGLHVVVLANARWVPVDSIGWDLSQLVANSLGAALPAKQESRSVASSPDRSCQVIDATSVAGTWWSGPGHEVAQAEVLDSRVLKWTEGGTARVLRLHDGRFSTLHGEALDLTLCKCDCPGCHLLKTTADGATVFRRWAPVSEEVLSQVVGRYHAPELDVEWTLVRCGHTGLQVVAPFGMRLYWNGSSAWTSGNAQPSARDIVLTREDYGLRLDASRARGIRLERIGGDADRGANRP